MATVQNLYMSPMDKTELEKHETVGSFCVIWKDKHNLP